MNIELLQKIKSAILNDAESFYMWEGALLDPEKSRPEHECFTTACIAGWAVFLVKGNLKDVSPDQFNIYPWSYFYGTGREVLYLDRTAAGKLFYKEKWPREFGDRYKDGPKTLEDFKSNAQTAADYIDYFIAHENEGNV